MIESFDILISKIEEFIRKYYVNQLIKGILLCIAWILAFFLIEILLEYYSYFTTTIRALLFYSYLLLTAVTIGFYVVKPLLKLKKIGKRLSYENAAVIIGKFFPEVSDKLLNTLQLKELLEKNPKASGLILAGIEQKSKNLINIPFVTIIDFRKNTKYLKYIIPPIIAVLLIVIISPGMITEPAKRIVKYNQNFERPKPFEFIVLNSKLTSPQLEDFTLSVKLIGNEIPKEVFIETDGSFIKMSKISNVRFSHTFKKIQKNLVFRLFADNLYSNKYEIIVLPKPIITGFEIEAVYPGYTGKTAETFSNTGDLTVPDGSLITWKIFTRDAGTIYFNWNEKKNTISLSKSNTAIFTQLIRNNGSYTITSSNNFFQANDSLQYTINVIPDEYPVIDIETIKDSIVDGRFYIKGLIKDDYGFSTLNFIVLQNDSNVIKKSIEIVKNQKNQLFYYTINFNDLNLEQGKTLSFLFEIWDNDAVNGPKKSSSQKVIYRTLKKTEIQKLIEENQNTLKNDLKSSIKDAKQIQKEIENINKKLFDKKELSWQDKQQIKNLIEKQKQLQQNIEELKKLNKENNIKEQQLNREQEELLEKQKELERLFNELMTDEMKQLFKELEMLLEQQDKQKINEALEKLKMSNEDIQKELDRNLALFKQLELEKKLNQTIENLKELSENQEELRKQTEDKSTNTEELKLKQENLNKEFEQLKEDLKDIQQKSQELEKPMDFKETENEQQEISNEMQNASEQIKQGNKNKATKSQKTAKEKMEQLAQKLEKMQQESQEEEIGEDIEALRMILKNLIKTSFDQEELMKTLRKTDRSNPKYVEIIREQKRLVENIKMIEDSLYALSKRQMSIQSFVNKEINKIDNSTQKALEYLLEANTIGPQYTNSKESAAGQMQFVMTSVNNLALMLSEALKQMQDEQQQQKSGKGKMCKKPKSGSSNKPNMTNMRKMQEQLNKQIEELKKGNKPGNTQQQGQSMSEQLARLAAQQEAIRRQLQQYREELLKNGGKDKGNLAKMIQEMEETESELVNKILSNDLLNRQQDILTRLLESEKAEREQEFEEKRESKEGKQFENRNPEEFLQYKRLKMSEEELLKTIPPSFKPFYRNKVNEYFYNL